MRYGFIDKILRVNLTTGTTAIEKIPEQWAKDYLGGAGLATKYLFEEVPADIDPLGKDNKLIFMTGPLTGTASASASRYSVVAKSPLTGLWGHGNSGGSFGPAMKRAGFDGFIFEGSSEIPVYLEILDGEAKLIPANNLWGKTVPETEDIIKDSSDRKVTIASIGPGGENLVRYAAIMNNKHRTVGRAGLGTVMGSKKLKAIVCAGKANFEIADPEGFKTTARRQIDFLDESMLKVGFEAFGTNMVSDMVNARGGYPTRNWQAGVFDDIEEVNSEALTNKVLDKGVSCFACPIACGRGTTIKEGKYAGKTGEGPEYESANTLGALCGVSDMNAITMANYLCNENGIDTISTGSTIAFAIECYEKGILTKTMTHGLKLEFGNADLVIDLVKKIAKREGIGDLLAEGSRIVAQKLGKNSSHFAMNVKGMELPAYDPRAAKICGLGYVTANRGGDHITSFIEGPTFIDSPFVLVDDSKIKDPFVADPQETKVVVDLENALTAFDAIGACKFMGMLLPASDYTELINYALGWEMDVADFRRCGERIYNLARLYNAKTGMTRTHDMLPGRLMKDPLPDGPAKGMVIEEETLEKMKDAYYDFRGWDKTTGNPGPEKLLELGIQKESGE
ncbi:MAG: aldehyde ferredoxin oxidoreductase family protein [Desulfobacula sp.]|nr:aldehyde ferredoxin oxidoreductase family protein [Desulfobacula sp.]